MKLIEAKKFVKEAQMVGREVENNPAAEAECKNMEEVLRKVALMDEPNSVKIN